MLYYRNKKRKEDTQMTTIKYAWTNMNIVDFNDQALDMRQGFGFAYTILNKRKKENM